MRSIHSTSLLRALAAGAVLTLSPAAMLRIPQSIWYVTTTGGGTGASWASPAILQQALDGSNTGDLLFVTEGIHNPTYETVPGNVRSRTFRVTHGVSIFGGYLGTEAPGAPPQGQGYNTSLSGDFGVPNVNTDNAWHVVTVNTTQKFQVYGATIFGGYVEAAAPAPIDGAGVWSMSEANLRFDDVYFDSNTAARDGGGLLVYKGSADLVRCFFLHNGAGYGGAISTGTDSTLRAYSCYFSANTASRSGGALNLTGGTAWFVNGLIRHGSAQTGAAITCGAGQTTDIINGTFGQNTSVGSPAVAAVLWSNASATTKLANCVVWSNTPSTNALAGAFSAEYCDVEGGVTGTGNINVNPGWSILSLAPPAGAATNDAGNNNDIAPDLLDLDGDSNTTEPVPFDRLGVARVVDDASAANTGCCGGTIVDMGAYESP